MSFRTIIPTDVLASHLGEAWAIVDCRYDLQSETLGHDQYLAAHIPGSVYASLGHEITHVANGDMVTLTLIQGVVNTFVIFLSRILGDIIDRTLFGRRDDEERSGNGPAYFIIVIVLQLVLGFLANLIVLWFSRYREFRADRGGAQLSGRENMIAALERLKAAHEPLPQQFASFGIAGDKSKLTKLFMSHPPLEERIAALKASGAVS